jgi:hypothetical protein
MPAYLREHPQVPLAKGSGAVALALEGLWQKLCRQGYAPRGVPVNGVGLQAQAVVVHAWPRPMTHMTTRHRDTHDTNGTGTHMAHMTGTHGTGAHMTQPDVATGLVTRKP